MTIYHVQQDLTPEQEALVHQYGLKRGDAFSDEEPVSSGIRGDLQNVGAGGANALINLVNLLPEGLGEITGKKIPEIPQMGGSYDRHSLPYMAGQIGASILPFVGAESAIEGAATHIPSLLTKLAASPFIKSSLAGATSGAAVSSPGDRSGGAVGGAIGGPIGTLLGKTVGTLYNQIRPEAALDKGLSVLNKMFAEPQDKKMDYAAKVIAKTKRALDKTNHINYQALWESLKNSEGVLPSMKSADFPEYSDALDGMRTSGGLPPFASKAKDIAGISKKMSTIPDQNLNENSFGDSLENEKPSVSEEGKEEEEKGVNPQDVHLYKSMLGKWSSGQSTAEKSQYGILRNALNNDFENFLVKNNPSSQDAYREAQEFYRNHYKPFMNNKAARLVSKQFGHRNLKDIPNSRYQIDGSGKIIDNKKDGIEEILHHTDWQGGSSSDLLKHLLPASSDPTMSKIKSAMNVLGGGSQNGEEGTRGLLRSLLANKYSKSIHGEININPRKFLKDYSNLSESQKKFMFSDEEREGMDSLISAGDKIPEGKSLEGMARKGYTSALGALAGLAGGKALLGDSGFSHALPYLMTAVGGFAPKALEGLRGAVSERLPDTLPELIPFLSSKGHPRAQKGLEALLSGLLASTGGSDAGK